MYKKEAANGISQLTNWYWKC